MLTLGRLSLNEIENVEILTKAGQPRLVIRSVLQQTNPGLVLCLSDICNIRARQQIESLAGRTHIQTLLQDLTTGALFYQHHTQMKKTMLHISLYLISDLLSCSANITIFCYWIVRTYRTNRYKMPFLGIFGCTSMNTTIQLALVFLCSETKDSGCIWALRVSLAHWKIPGLKSLSPGLKKRS